MKRAAVLVFVLLTAGLLALTGIVSTQAATVCDPGAFLFRESRLWHVDPLTAAVTEITSLPRELNAMGVKGSDFYAIARPPARAVRFGTDGVLTDIGPIADAPADHFAAAYSGAIDGDNWYLLQDGTVYTVSLTQKAVIATAAVKGTDIGDWAFHNGKLLALSTIGTTDLISIDPATGSVTRLSEPAGLPEGSSFGALWIIDEQLYSLHNGTGQLYRIHLPDPSKAVPIGTGGLTTVSSDGAACPAPPPPMSGPSLSASARPSAVPSPSHAEPVAGPPLSALPEPAVPEPAVPPAALPLAAQPQPAAVVEPAAPAAPGRVAPVVTRAPQMPVAAQGVPQWDRNAPVAPPPPDRSRTRRWIAAGVVALGIGGLLGFLGVNRSRS